MAHSYEILRAGADYELRKGEEGYSTWTLVDKRTNHKWLFSDVQPRGFKDHVYLYKLRDDEGSPSIGNRVALLDKNSIPERLIEEFHHIRETGEATPATDPR